MDNVFNKYKDAYSILTLRHVANVIHLYLILMIKYAFYMKQKAINQVL